MRIDIFLRAVAVLLVALNHADDMVDRNNWLNGGMSVLMMVSGMAFARLALDGESPARAVRTLTHFAVKLLAATLAVVFLTTPIRETSLLVWSGFVYTFTELPFWYGAQMAVICLGLAVLFQLVGARFLRRPLAASLLLLAGLLAVHTVCEAIWDTHLLEHRLPHLLAWNFVLGWALYFLTRKRQIALALAVAGVSAAVGWGLKSDALYLFAGCLAAITIPAVRLPRPLAHATQLVAQATFFIYLTSWIFVVGLAHAAHRVIAATSLAGNLATIVAVWVVGVTASVALWVLCTATVRAFHALRIVERPALARS